MLKLLPEDNFCVLCTNMHKFDFDFKQELPLQHSFKYLQICALLVLLLFSSFFFFFFFVIGSPVAQAGTELLTLQASISLVLEWQAHATMPGSPAQQSQY